MPWQKAALGFKKLPETLPPAAVEIAALDRNALKNTSSFIDI
jgi:hypothetical protein